MGQPLSTPWSLRWILEILSILFFIICVARPLTLSACRTVRQGPPPSGGPFGVAVLDRAYQDSPEFAWLAEVIFVPGHTPSDPRLGPGSIEVTSAVLDIARRSGHVAPEDLARALTDGVESLAGGAPAYLFFASDSFGCESPDLIGRLLMHDGSEFSARVAATQMRNHIASGSCRVFDAAQPARLLRVTPHDGLGFALLVQHPLGGPGLWLLPAPGDTLAELR